MGTVATTHALFLLFLAEALLGLEFLEFSCGHGDAGGCAAVELPVGSKMGHGGHHVMIHIWQRQWTHLAFAGSGLLQETRRESREEPANLYRVAYEDGWIWAS